MLTEYFSVKNWFIAIPTLAIIYGVFLIGRSNTDLLNGNKRQTWGWMFAILVWLYIGTRPIWCYTDTHLYTTMFNLVQTGQWKEMAVEKNEWFWELLQAVCLKITTASGWLTIIAFFYIGGMCWAAYKWLPRHFSTVIFFLFTAFSFWGYATNGIRNGMASSLVMAGLAYVTPTLRQNLTKAIPAVGLILIGCGTHNSMYLVAITALIAYMFPNPSRAIKIWLICVLISPFSSRFFIDFGSLFIEDRRFVSYGLSDIDSNLFNRTGWRWDFILYSSLPIILGWYTLTKKELKNWTYTFILNVYTYTNAAWVLINDVSYSNRFAYISWFLYPIVLCYPLLKFNIVPKQSMWVSIFLIGSVIFSLIF